jgi:hypothetical protein
LPALSSASWPSMPSIAVDDVGAGRAADPETRARGGLAPAAPQVRLDAVDVVQATKKSSSSSPLPRTSAYTRTAGPCSRQRLVRPGASRSRAACRRRRGDSCARAPSARTATRNAGPCRAALGDQLAHGQQVGVPAAGSGRR